MKRYIDEINNNITNIRTAIKDQGADIDENTPLDKYAEKIESIEKTKVTVGHTIIPLYCYAENYYDASKKETPEITWNSDTVKWDVKEKGGWTKDVPEKSIPGSLLYAMFVPIKCKQNSDDDDFEWPTPIQIQGKQGEKGDTGRDGRDGVIAGMVQYLAAHLFKVVKRIDAKDALRDVPNLEYDYVRAKNKGQPEPEFLYDPGMKDENGNITSYINSSVNGSNNNWGLSYTMPTEEPGEYVVLKCVASYNSLNTAVTVTDPIMLSGEGVIGWTEYYSVTPVNIEPDEETVWVENAIPDEFYTSGPHYLWNITKIDYDSDRTVATQPIMIMSSPNAVDTIECLYGQSSNISTEPDEWTENIPDDFIVLWKKETTNFTLGNSKVTTTPIAVKGNPGVDILAQVNKQDVKTWTPANMAGFNSEEYYLKKGIVVGKDLYIWNGSVEPDWADEYENVNNTYYWIIIRDAFATKVQADWSELDPTSSGYVSNKPITVSDFTDVVSSGNIYYWYNTAYLPILPHQEIVQVKAHFYSDKQCTNEIGNYLFTKDNNVVVINDTTFVWQGSEIVADKAVFDSYVSIQSIYMSADMSVIQTQMSQRYVNNIIDLKDCALAKIMLLKQCGKLIPGYIYTFKYGKDNDMYSVTAINSNTLDKKCISSTHTIFVNWDYCQYETLKGNKFNDFEKILVRGRWIISEYMDGNVSCTEYYEFGTNLSWNHPANNNQLSDYFKYPLKVILDIRGYKDVRGNEWNAYLNEFSGTYTITFGETCFCNKVDIYLTGAGTNVINISSDSNNNTFVCYNGANITCNNSVGNSINTYKVTNQMTITNSHLNRVSLYNNQTFDLDNANCNIVNVRSMSNYSSLKLQQINSSLITLHNLNEALTISNSYSGCGIFSINAFKNKTANTASIYATDVYDL